MDTPTVLIRPARPDDLPTIVDFNARLAWESERQVLDRGVLALGVERALTEPGCLRYWLAEAAAEPVGQCAISLEWSDWRNGWLWWFQSVYVVPAWRGRGVFKALFQQVKVEAKAAGNVVGFRLYVEQENLAAQRAYQALGLKPGGYLVLEDLWGREPRDGGQGRPERD